MKIRSATGLARQSEGWGQEAPPGAASRLDRRRFLQSGALTVAGVATLAGVELMEAPWALAQSTSAAASVDNFVLLSAAATPVLGNPTLQICRHSYRFDYHLSDQVPPDLVETYRLNAGTAFPTVVPGGAVADRLQPLLQPTPFQQPAAAPAGFPPAPDAVPPAGPSLVPQQLLPLVCYRLVQVLVLQTFPPQQIARVFDWCSLYCFPGNIIVIAAGDKCVCYRASGGTQQPPPQKNIVDDSPRLIDFWQAVNSGVPHSIGGVYYYTYNSQQGAVSTAIWQAQLNVTVGTQCRVDAHIPGSAQPQNRTAGARYQVFNAGFISANVVRNQQLATSQWVNLGTFPFRPGTFEVHLTDETGEPTGSRIVVADAVRWVSA
jgi:hypothetical protein